jgi:hypothetical protein
VRHGAFLGVTVTADLGAGVRETVSLEVVATAALDAVVFHVFSMARARAVLSPRCGH